MPLIVDRESRIGTTGATLSRVTLHNQVHVTPPPYMPFPATWPAYVPKDKLAGWFEPTPRVWSSDFWTAAPELSGGSYDDGTEC